jgi:hypothetical protein
MLNGISNTLKQRFHNSLDFDAQHVPIQVAASKPQVKSLGHWESQNQMITVASPKEMTFGRKGRFGVVSFGQSYFRIESAQFRILSPHATEAPTYRRRSWYKPGVCRVG